MGEVAVKRRPSTLGTARGLAVFGEGRSPARRQLFGPVDHDQLRSDWHREIARVVEEKGREWNFDFGRGTPLEGAYTWEKMQLFTPESKTVRGKVGGGVPALASRNWVKILDIRRRERDFFSAADPSKNDMENLKRDLDYH